MTTTRSTKVYEIPCTNCGATTTSRRRPVPGLRIDCGKTECIKAVTEAHNADAARYDAEAKERAAARRAERKANPPAPRHAYVYGDMGQIARMYGIVKVR